MKDTMKMRRELQPVIERAKAINEKAKRENRDLTEEEQDRYDSVMGEVKKRKKEIEEAEEQNRIEMGGVEMHAGPAKDRSYRSMFYNNDSVTLDRGGFESFNEYLTVIASGRHDPRLFQERQQIQGQGALGGFLCPTEYSAMLLDQSLEREIVRRYATIYPMQTSSRQVPAWDASDRSDGRTHGGFDGEWLAEGRAATNQEARLRLMTLEARKLAIYCQASNELLADGMGFESQLSNAMIDSVAFHLDRAFLTGDGVGKPLGILNDPARIEVARTGFPSQAPGDNYLDLVNMYSRLFTLQADRPIIIASKTLKPELMTMTDVNGNLLWQVNARDGSPGMILGFPVYFTEKLPTLGNPGALAMVNLKHYLIGMRKEAAIDSSNAPGWQQDLMSFRTILRVDGQGSWDQPLTTVDGEEYSWIVTLG